LKREKRKVENKKEKEKETLLGPSVLNSAQQPKPTRAAHPPSLAATYRRARAPATDAVLSSLHLPLLRGAHAVRVSPFLRRSTRACSVTRRWRNLLGAGPRRSFCTPRVINGSLVSYATPPPLSPFSSISRAPPTTPFASSRRGQ
jgi:hypothetical protein